MKISPKTRRWLREFVRDPERFVARETPEDAARDAARYRALIGFLRALEAGADPETLAARGWLRPAASGEGTAGEPPGGA